MNDAIKWKDEMIVGNSRSSTVEVDGIEIDVVIELDGIGYRARIYANGDVCAVVPGGDQRMSLRGAQNAAAEWIQELRERRP